MNRGGDPTSAVLQYCAQSTSSFYPLTSASQTATVFTQNGTQLTKLRVLNKRSQHGNKKARLAPGFFFSRETRISWQAA